MVNESSIDLEKGNPEVEDGEMCGRCIRSVPIIDVGDYGSDPFISNFLCRDCLTDLAILFLRRPVSPTSS